MSERGFDCRATSALLRSGRSVALAGHVAALICAVMRPGAWWALGAWCVLVYFAVRVELDARLFEVLADHSPEALDAWLEDVGLRKNIGPRTLADRRRGAMRLWRGLLMALVVEIVLVAGALVWSPR